MVNQHGQGRSQSAERRTILRLVLFGLVYNVAEGILCVGFGAATRSVVLVGFGLDSGIEAVAAFAAWRYLQGQITEQSERRLSTLVGWTFLALSAYILIQSSYDLIEGREVEASSVGFAVTAVSLLIMPVVGIWKLRLARRLGSRGLQAEAKETIACSYLSLFAVLGTGIRYFGGPSWVDAMAALLMLPWLIREGFENVLPEADEEG